MFENMRSKLIQRLGALIDRFQIIESRSLTQLRECQHSVRVGFQPADSCVIYSEIAEKALDQAALCGQAISGLMVDRAWPFIYRRGVVRAEKFAAQCEAVLDETILAKKIGQVAFRQHFGIQTDVEHVADDSKAEETLPEKPKLRVEELKAKIPMLQAAEADERLSDETRRKASRMLKMLGGKSQYPFNKQNSENLK